MVIGPLIEISKPLDEDEGPHDVDGFRGVWVHPEQHIFSRATLLAGYKSKLETCASESNPTTLATATHLLGVFVRFVVDCCGKRVRIPYFVEIDIDLVHTRTWRPTFLPSPITPNFASAMQMKY